MKRATRFLSILSALAMTVTFAVPALADGAALVGGSGLVRGGASLPRFGAGFSIDSSTFSPAPAGKDNLEISLTSPDHSVLRFLFSPRVLSGETHGFGPTVTGNYVGLAWSVFDNDRLFGTIALTGSVNRQALDSPVPRLYGPLLSLHSTVELGYAFNAQQSLSLSLDHSTPTPFAGDYLRLRYGYHF